MGPVRLGIVGCGGISERHGRAAASSPQVAIVACCDVRADLAEEWSERFGCERAYDNYQTMIREHELDGVLVATWPSHHREHILGCLEAGARRILCEKSLVLDGAEALEVWGAAEEVGALVVEALMYRHHPAIRRIERLAAAGEIGEIDSISASFSLFDPEEAAPDDPGRDWRQRKEYGGGVPYDLACYCIDACNLLARALPQRVLALAETSDRYGTIDRLHGLIEYERGPVGVVASSRRSDFDHELRINGAHGRMLLPVAWRIEDSTEVLVQRSVGWGEFETTRYSIAAVDSFRLQLESFATAVRGNGAPTPGLMESLVTAFTLDALLTSAAERAPVSVDLPDTLHAA
jgi:D-xylose 1-dehydrogenase (NADP+, D-xylono-1,5-lactone-forming)